MGLIRRIREVCFQTNKSDTRGTWQCRLDPFFVMLGVFIYPSMTDRMSYYTVRYGIPYLAPFFLSLFVIGIPLIVIELALGQFSRSGEFKSWRFARILQGIGLAKITVNGIYTIITGVINSWYIYYMVVSFSESPLPWRNCNPEWTNDECYSYEDATIQKGNCSYDGYPREGDVCVFDNKTGYRKDWSSMEYFPSSQYFRNVVYGRRSNDAPFGFDLGDIRWRIAVSYLASFVLTFLALSMSVKTYGKVAYLTTILPIILGIYLLIEGLNLPGYEKGTGAMLNRDTYLDDLKSITTDDGTRFVPPLLVPSWTRAWSAGVFHVFYGLSLCTGTFTTIGSYNRKNTNFIWDVLVGVVLCVALTFLFTYSQSTFIGHLFHLYDVKTPKYYNLGILEFKFKGIAHVFSMITRGPAISGVFYMMQFLRGLNQQLAGVETLRTTIVDIFPRLRRLSIFVLLGVCVLIVLLGLPLLTDNGDQLLAVVDSSIAFWTLLLIPLTQCIAVVYLYAFMTKEPLRIFRDVQAMIGQFWVNIPMIWCMLCWAAFIPAAMIMMIYLGYLHFLDNDSKIMWDKFDKAEDLAWVLAVTIPVLMVIGALMALLCVVLNWFRTRRLDVLTILQPTADWGKSIRNINEMRNNDALDATEMNRKI